MIYTSYFAKANSFPSNFAPISIARFTPKWWTGYRMIDLAPAPEILLKYKEDNDQAAYTEAYNKFLTTKDPHKLEEILKDRLGDKVPVLCCFERPDAFCHRHLVQKWLNDNGIECEEWKRS